MRRPSGDQRGCESFWCGAFVIKCAAPLCRSISSSARQFRSARGAYTHTSLLPSGAACGLVWSPAACVRLRGIAPSRSVSTSCVESFCSTASTRRRESGSHAASDAPLHACDTLRGSPPAARTTCTCPCSVTASHWPSGDQRGCSSAQYTEGARSTVRRCGQPPAAGITNKSERASRSQMKAMRSPFGESA